MAKKQHTILPNTRHKVHLDSSVVVSVRATWHVHISPACIRPLATSGTFVRCHGSVVDQAPTWPEINTRYSQNTRHKMHLDSSFARVGATCRSRPHGDTHSRRLARLQDVMVVWWTKHQPGPKSTRDTPKHTSQDSPRRDFSRLGTHLPRADLDHKYV